MTDGRQPKIDSLVSLRDYFESRMDSYQLAIDSARELMEARLERQEAEMERRLDALNHLRENTISKGEYVAGHAGLTSEFHTEAATLRAEVGMLKEWKAEMRGKASAASVYVAYALAICGLIVSLVNTIHNLVQ